MPGPLAKGLVISISLLVAAGLAVYDNPQVRAWLDESRRKIAMTLHNFGDEISPRSDRERRSQDDVSTREDQSPDSAERRKAAREEILRKAQVIQQRRNARISPSAERSTSFDDIVDVEGRLKQEEKIGTSASTAINSELATARDGLRERHHDTQRADTNASLPPVPAKNSPYPEVVPSPSSTQEPINQQKIMREAAAISSTVGVEDGASSRRSDQLSNLTPTTSAPQSPCSPTSLEHPAGMHDQQSQGTDFQSVREWTQLSSSSFYSGLERGEGLADGHGPLVLASPSATSSIFGSVEQLSERDAVSEVGGLATPSTWTEVGSVVSENEL